MTSKTHDVFALAALLTTARYLGPNNYSTATIITGLIANIIGALLPDIDQATNRLWDMLPAGNAVGRVLRKLFLSHRTITHSILGVILVYFGSNRLIPKLLNAGFVDTNAITWALLIGYLSHLILDGLTEDGLPLFFPLKWKFGFPPIRSWRIKTGKWFEKYIVFPLIILYLVGWGIWNIDWWWKFPNVLQ